MFLWESMKSHHLLAVLQKSWEDYQYSEILMGGATLPDLCAVALLSVLGASPGEHRLLVYDKENKKCTFPADFINRLSDFTSGRTRQNMVFSTKFGSQL